MHALTGVSLLFYAIVSHWTAHQREGKGEDCYRAALAADTDAGREVQLALFTVFKTQVASYHLRADLCLIAALVISFLFDHEVTAEMHAFVAGLP
jgi:hypothetical protein